MSFVMDLVRAFVEIAKGQRNDFIESWLQDKVNDYDMDMYLIEEKKHRSLTYKRIFNDIPNQRLRS